MKTVCVGGGRIFSSGVDEIVARECMREVAINAMDERVQRHPDATGIKSYIGFVIDTKHLEDGRLDVKYLIAAEIRTPWVPVLYSNPNPIRRKKKRSI